MYNPYHNYLWHIMMVCTAIYMYIHDICRYLYPINWQHQGLLTYFCQAIHTIHMSCSHKRPLVLDFFVTPHGPSGVVLMQSLGNRETWWRIAKFTWQIYRKILTMHWNFGYCTPPRPICRDCPKAMPAFFRSKCEPLAVATGAFWVWSYN